MLQTLKSIFKSKKRTYAPIDPDEIFIDSQNLPDFDRNQFEGRIEKPIGKRVFSLVGIFIFFVGCVFVWKMYDLQIVNGEVYKQKSENNSLQTTRIFANRGLIVDRNLVPLAWNEINPATTSEYSLRRYATSTGLSTTLGYVKYPAKDSSGFYWADEFDAKDGLEKVYNKQLTGVMGKKIEETDVKGNVVSQSVIEEPKDGATLVLSIDSRVQKKLNESMLNVANMAGYKGGSGIIMDLHNGEIIAASNFPEYDSQVMTDGVDNAKINTWLKDKNHPFLNRAVSGLYTPGSIVKPFVAMGVLSEGVIDPRRQILSTGSITIPNPYTPSKPSIFYDWKAHGMVDIRRALAVSSNVYFYEVTGGFKEPSGFYQKGIGIDNIEKYVRMFGLGSTTQINFPGEKEGIIPDPAWKEKVFNEDWRVGDTYNTAIGQYGFQITPLQAVRSVAAIGNEGTILVPTFIKGDKVKVSGNVTLNSNTYKIVKEGMRMCVVEGTCQPLKVPYVDVAAKTGTAQIGLLKDEVNSWVIGFWPYENPKYAFAVVMEKGSKNNQFSSTLVMKGLFEWMGLYGEEYLK
jgi:penicillin-binding protein 2